MLKQEEYNVVSSTRNRKTNKTSMQLDFSKPSEVVNQKINDIDFMIHTVSPNEILYKFDKYSALAESVAGTRAALDFCIKNNIKNFIYFSSFHVFGNQEGLLTENTIPEPLNDYGLSHYMAEQTIGVLDRREEVNAWILRPSNLFGVPVDLEKFKRWNLIPFLFCKEAVEKQTITLMTSGLQLRNFVGISDLFKKVLWVLQERPGGRVIHVNGKESISVFELAKLVQDIAYKKYGLSIDINRPYGEGMIKKFDFKSIYDIAAPTENLYSFTEKMLGELLARK